MRSLRRSLARPLLLLAIGSTAACGGDSTAPPTPSVARVVANGPTLALFVTRAVPLASFVTAYDAQGHIIAPPPGAIRVELPAGWTLRNDTVIAPQAERVGTLRFSVAGAAHASRGALAAEGVLDSLADTVQVVATIDLRKRRWQATWGCTTTSTPASDRPGLAVDSSFWTAAIDSAVYDGDTSWTRTGLQAKLAYHATGVRWLSPIDSGTGRSTGASNIRDTVAVRDTVILGRQRPDTLEFYASVLWQTGGRAGAPAVRRSGGLTSPPLVYAGGTWCNARVYGDGWQPGLGVPLVLSEIP